MSTCKECRWWIGYPKEGSPLRSCMMPKLLKMPTPPPSDGALPGYMPEFGIDTGPDFGCIHFETNPGDLLT